MGGWGIVAADVLVMASLAQVAGQYVFLLVGADGIGGDATSGWVLLVGMIWIVLMTGICYVGIEISANFQKVLLAIELSCSLSSRSSRSSRLRQQARRARATSALSWFNPAHLSFSHFVQASADALHLLGLGHCGLGERGDRRQERTPGRAAVISTMLLLATYALVAIAAVGFAGVGTKGIGLANQDNSGDVIRILGSAVRRARLRLGLLQLLCFMVLTSAAASTQTTILPTARTTLSMAAYKAIPRRSRKIHPRYLTPTVSTLAMGGVSIALYLVLNYVAAGNIIADSVPRSAG